MDPAVKAAHQRVDDTLAQHPIENPTLRTRVEKLRSAAKVFSHGIVDLVPEGPERDRALMGVREALLIAIDGIELHQPKADPRIRPSVIDEATARAYRDGKMRQEG